MFRAIPCSSSGGQIILLQHLASLLSVSSYSVYRLTGDCSPLSTGALSSCLRRVTMPDAVKIQFDLLMMSMVLKYNLTSWWWAWYSSEHVEDY